MSICVSGGKDQNYYQVSEVDFENCVELEKLFRFKKIVPIRTLEIESNARVVTMRKYWEYFELSFTDQIRKKMKKGFGLTKG